jgi:hypothetical protein
MKQCQNCHFLINEYVSIDTNKLEKQSLSQEQRCNIKNIACIYSQKSPSHINCYNGIWNIKTFDEKNKLYNFLVENKKNCSEYELFNEHMNLEAAHENKKLKFQKSQTKTNNKVVIFAALLGGIIGALATFFVAMVLKIIK